MSISHASVVEDLLRDGHIFCNVSMGTEAVSCSSRAVVLYRHMSHGTLPANEFFYRVSNYTVLCRQLHLFRYFLSVSQRASIVDILSTAVGLPRLSREADTCFSRFVF